MARFRYLTKKFEKKKRQPLSEKEYKIIDEAFEYFIKLNFTDEKKRTSEFLKDAYPFKIRLIIILVFGLLSLFLNYYFVYPKKMHDWWNIVHFVTLISVVNLIVFAFSFFRSKMEMNEYYADFRIYYKYHKKIIMRTNSYQEYLTELKNNKLWNRNSK